MLALSKFADVPLGSCTAHIHAPYIVRSSSLLGMEQVLGWRGTMWCGGGDALSVLFTVLLAGHKSRDF